MSDKPKHLYVTDEAKEAEIKRRQDLFVAQRRFVSDGVDALYEEFRKRWPEPGHFMTFLGLMKGVAPLKPEDEKGPFDGSN